MTAPQPKACPVCGSYAKQSTFEHGDNSVWCSNADCPLCLLVMSESTWSRLLLAPPGAVDPVCVERGEMRATGVLRDFVVGFVNHRAKCWDHDDDMGNERRPFFDEEEWDRIEQQAADALSMSKYVAAPAPPQEPQP